MRQIAVKLVAAARRRRQAQLARLLASCEVDPVGPQASKAAGVLCGRAGTSDVVDATVVVMATALRAAVWTSDARDIAVLADKSGAKPRLVVRKA